MYICIYIYVCIASLIEEPHQGRMVQTFIAMCNYLLKAAGVFGDSGVGVRRGAGIAQRAWPWARLFLVGASAARGACAGTIAVVPRIALARGLSRGGGRVGRAILAVGTAAYVLELARRTREATARGACRPSGAACAQTCTGVSAHASLRYCLSLTCVCVCVVRCVCVRVRVCMFINTRA